MSHSDSDLLPRAAATRGGRSFQTAECEILGAGTVAITCKSFSQRARPKTNAQNTVVVRFENYRKR